MSALMQPARRWLAPILLAALLIPSLGMVLARTHRRSDLEKRMLAAPPAWPHGLDGWSTYPRRMDAYLRDNFALRPWLTAQGNRLHWQLGTQLGGGTVIRGKNDWLFLRDNLLTVTGGEVRKDLVRDYTDYVCGMNSRLRERGTPLLFSMAPSSAAIYPEALPDWMPRGRPSGYDLILDGVRRCGVNAVDLRPPLFAAKAGDTIYFHRDTHWSRKGALIAYDRLVQALERSSWAIRPSSLAWRRRPEELSDLVAMSGATDLKPLDMVQPDLEAVNASLTKTPVAGLTDPSRSGAFVETTGHAGPTVLVIGDSYSADFFPPYFASHVGRFAWIHQQGCAFDWRIFDAVKPDYVILMPVDRWGACHHHAKSSHMPDS